MNRKQFERLLSSDKTISKYLRGAYEHFSDIHSFELLIDLNELNIFCVQQSDSKKRRRWVAIVIGTNHSYYIDSLAAKPSVDIQQTLDHWALNGHTNLPVKKTFSATNKKLSFLSACLILYYLDKICNQKRLGKIFGNNLQVNQQILYSWWRQSKYGRYYR